MRPHNQITCGIKKLRPIEERRPSEIRKYMSKREWMIWSGDFIEGNPLTKDQREVLAAAYRREESKPEAYMPV